MSENVKESFKIQTKSVREQVYETLKNAIFDGRYEGGYHLSERVLANKFGVSTTPIKEALRHLEKEGLVITKPRKGTFVSESIMNSVEEINLARAALEGVAAQLAASKITDKELEELENIIKKMEFYTKEGNNKKVSSYNITFHNIIRKAARNDYIFQQIKSVHSFDQFFREKALDHHDELDRAFEDHYLIFNKIKNRDPEGAENAMRKHIHRTTLFVKNKIKRND